MTAAARTHGVPAELLHLAAPEPLLAVDRSFAAALPRPAQPGAFDWWYLDARDRGGDGLVLIWASRLPFFPADRPSLNLALYRRGRPDFWLLVQPERSAAGARLEADGFELELQAGRDPEQRPCLLRLQRAAGVVSVEVQLDLPIPGDRRRLRGQITAVGPCALGEGPARLHPHRWVPIAPRVSLAARLSLQAHPAGPAEPLFSFDGAGYLDRNLGDRPLAELGLRRWEWGRTVDARGCRAFYLLEGSGGERQGLLLDSSTGELVQQAVPGWETSGRRLTLHGPAPLVVDRGAAVERGPFYTRSFGTLGAGAPLVYERCEVGRIGLRWMEPLVRMRLHRPDGGDSLWAPLFSGPRRGRLRRLLLGERR